MKTYIFLFQIKPVLYISKHYFYTWPVTVCCEAVKKTYTCFIQGHIFQVQVNNYPSFFYPYYAQLFNCNSNYFLCDLVFIQFGFNDNNYIVFNSLFIIILFSLYTLPLQEQYFRFIMLNIKTFNNYTIVSFFDNLIIILSFQIKDTSVLIIK